MTESRRPCDKDCRSPGFFAQPFSAIPSAESVPGVPGLWKLEAGTNGYLLVCGRRSLLIDCPSADLDRLLEESHLPCPATIIHTHRQPEHCREAECFPKAVVYGCSGGPAARGPNGLVPGRVFQWEDVELAVLPLPGAGPGAVGLLWRGRDILFSGDLVRDGGQPIHPIEGAATDLQASLTAVMLADFFLLLPSTGPVIRNPCGDCRALLSRLA